MTVSKEHFMVAPSGGYQAKVLLFGLISVALAVPVYLTFALLTRHFEDVKFEELVVEKSRNFKLVPFDILDATRYCTIKTQVRFGEDLKQSYIDELSTREDENRGIYKVFMFASLESTGEEKAVHCFVDPEERVVTHYRAMDRYKKSLVSKVLRFFK